MYDIYIIINIIKSFFLNYDMNFVILYKCSYLKIEKKRKKNIFKDERK